MTIVTKSHIDEQHAQSQYFSMAESEDGLFSWMSGADGYVQITCALTGLPPNTPSGQYSIYLQYAELRLGKDHGLTPELIASAREFSNAVSREKSRRRDAEEKAELSAMQAERQAREESALKSAIESGKPALIAQAVWPCDRSAVDCSSDIVAFWIRPDGSKYETRTHTH